MEGYIDDIIVGIVIVLFLVGYFSIKVKKGYTNQFSLSRNFSGKAHRQILTKYFQYYNLLSDRGKRKFLRRVGYFISIKQFNAIDFKEITEEMKTLIAASAIQLTFGLPEIYLSNFKIVNIYSGEGEVERSEDDDVISINWKRFFDGYLQPSGSYNYGLHEMAKTLQVENKIMNDEYGFLNEPDLESWIHESEAILKGIDSGEITFFTEFKAGDRENLFPVVIESFFERSVEFRNNFPNLYKVISSLLNQSPVRLLEVRGLKAD